MAPVWAWTMLLRFVTHSNLFTRASVPEKAVEERARGGRASERGRGRAGRRDDSNQHRRCLGEQHNGDLRLARCDFKCRRRRFWFGFIVLLKSCGEVRWVLEKKKSRNQRRRRVRVLRAANGFPTRGRCTSFLLFQLCKGFPSPTPPTGQAGQPVIDFSLSF